MVGLMERGKSGEKSVDLKSAAPISITSETLNELKAKIEEEWETYKIPYYFREIFRKSVFPLSRHKAVAIISREIEDLKRKRSYVQNAIDAVKAREEGIKNIKEMLQYFAKSPDWEKSEELYREVLDMLNAYRILTLNAVESIIKWKEQLVYALILNKSDSIGKHKTLQFMWEDQNYIIKMRSDMNFLYGSDFMKVFNFSELPDPLLIVPSKPLEKKNIKPNEYLKYLTIPTMLTKRVKLADRYIMDEEREESQPTTAQPKPSKRIDEKAAKKILEELVEHTCEKNLKDIVGKVYGEEKKSHVQNTAKKLKGDIITELVFKEVKDVAFQVYQEAIDGPMKKYLEGLLGKYIEEEIDRTVKVVIKEEKQNAKMQLKENMSNEKRLKKEREISEKKRKEDETAAEKKKREEEAALEKKRKEDEAALEKKRKEEEAEIERKRREEESALKKRKKEDEAELERKRKEEESALKKKKKEDEAELERKRREEEAALKKKKEEEAQRKKIEEEYLQIAKMILESLLKELHIDINLLIKIIYDEEVERKRLNESKSHKLNMDQIVEQITRVMIEDEINRLNLNLMAEEIAKEAIEEKKRKSENESEKRMLEKRERSMQNDKLAESVYSEILDLLISRQKFDKISEKMIENVERFRNTMTINTSIIKNATFDPDDYAVDEFTPGEHSPQLYNEEDKKEEEDNLSPRKFEEIPYDFSNVGEFTDLDDLEWVPVAVKEENVDEVYNDYYPSLNPNIIRILPTVDQLLLECYKGIDPCWYWGVKSNKIVGSVVYSLDYLSSDRKLTVHHLSSIDFGLFEKFIDAATNFLFSIDACEEIRVNLLVPFGQELPQTVKKIYTNLKFKWKANADSGVKGCDLNVMGKLRTSSAISGQNNGRTSELITFSLKSACLIEPSDTPLPIDTKICDEMIQVGNRQCQVNSLLNLFGKLDKSGILLSSTTNTRLQTEISDILEIINSTDSFNFPNIISLVSEDPSQANEFLKSNSLTDFTTSQKSSISVLDISFRFISCAFIQHMVKANAYRFIRFKSQEILVGSEFQIYSIPTSLQYIRAVFIKYDNLKEEINGDMRRDKTDLFYKVENVLKSVTYQSGEMKEFTVPAFKKKVNWIIPWLQGYEIPPQREEKASQFVKKSFETVKVNVEAPTPAKGILNLNKNKGCVFDGNFVFCLTHKGLDRVLDMPLFVCLVEPQDWIVS